MIESKKPEVQAFWKAFCERQGVPPETPYHARTFSDPALSSVVGYDLAELAREGNKRGTCHMALDFERNGVPRRKPGDYLVILNGKLAPRCVVRMTAVEVMPFDAVSEEFAASEGEGDLSRAYWARVHQAYFEKQLERWGMSFEDTCPVVCESFELVWAAPD